MSVRIRLTRRGRKKLAMYDIVVADSKAPRDGRFIEKLGNYNPNTHPATIVLDDAKALKWVMNGALPTETAQKVLSIRGIMLKKHLQVGVNKGAITQEVADARFEEWKKAKDAKLTKEADELNKKKESVVKSRVEAESKVNEARAAVLRKKQEEAEEARRAKELEAAQAIKAQQAEGAAPAENAEAPAENA